MRFAIKMCQLGGGNIIFNLNRVTLLIKLIKNSWVKFVCPCLPSWWWRWCLVWLGYIIREENGMDTRRNTDAGATPRFFFFKKEKNFYNNFCQLVISYLLIAYYIFYPRLRLS